MGAPQEAHLLNWNTFRLREEEVDRYCHNEHPSREEQEDSKLHVT